MHLGTISSKDWIITIGTYPVIGLAENSNITIEKFVDQNSVSVGIGADWTFVEDPNEGGTLSFTTQRNSPSNTLLHQLQLNKTAFPVSLTNRRNGTKHTMAYAKFTRQPTDGANNGTAAQTLDWAVISGEIDSTLIGAIVG